MNPPAFFRPLRPSALFCLFLFLLPAACSTTPRVISTPPAKVRVDAPAKQTPAWARIPATQRPYQIQGKTYYPIPSAQGYEESGIASWYGSKFHGRRTSNGEIYDMHAMSAAHKTLPMDTHVVVKNLDNDKEITVRINDRGPFVKGRIIDLSYRAAQELAMDKNGLARVRVTALGEARKYREEGQIRERFVTTPDFEHGDFYIQIGSFTNPENAVRLKEQLLSWGRKTVIMEYDHGGQIFHRVQVRGGDTMSEAGRMERAMVEAGFPDAFVIAR